jgi:hypothetical protein
LVEVDPKDLQRLAYLILRLALSAERIIKKYPNAKFSQDKKSRVKIIETIPRDFVEIYQEIGKFAPLLPEVHQLIKTLLEDTAGIFADIDQLYSDTYTNSAP